MKKILTKFWFIILMCRIEWHNRKYKDFMGVDLSCGKDMTGVTIYIKDNSCEEAFNMFEISKFFNKKYYDLHIRKGFESTNITINPYVDGTFSDKKLLIKELKSRNLI